MSRSLITLSLIGMIAIAWQLTGQETKPSSNSAKQAAKQSPAAAYQNTKREAELKILQALNKPVSVEFEETPLNDVIGFFGKLLNVPVIINEVAISDEGIAVDEPINFQVKDIAARSALDTILDRLELTWLIHDEVLEITSRTAAEEQLVTIVYDVSDLVALAKPRNNYGINNSGGFSGTGSGGTANQQQLTTNNRCGGGFFNVNDETTDKKKKQTDDQAPQQETEGGGLGGGCITNWGSNQYGQFTPTQPEKVLNFDQLIELIQNTTSGPWEEIAGVGGTISEYNHTPTKRQLLVIRQTRRMHREIEEILSDLRAGDPQQKKPISPVVEYRKRARVAEQKILAALNKTIPMKFKDAPLRDVVQFVGHALKIPVHFDEVAISDEGLAIDEPITFASKNIAARSALKIMLSRLDLTWVVRREILHITSMTQADEWKTTKVYDVSDVISFYKEPQQGRASTHQWPGGFGGRSGYVPGSFFGGGGGYFNMADQKSNKDGKWKTVAGAGGSVKPAETTIVDDFGTSNKKKAKKKNMVPDFDSLIEIIQNETSGPWEEIEGVGGNLQEFEHVGNKSYYVVIRHSYQVHLQVENLLRGMQQKLHSSSDD